MLSTMLESWPIQFGKHGGQIRISKVIIKYKFGSIMLCHFKLVNVTHRWGDQTVEAYSRMGLTYVM